MPVSVVLGGCLSADWTIYCVQQKNYSAKNLNSALCFKYLCKYAYEHAGVSDWSFHTLSSFGISVKRPDIFLLNDRTYHDIYIL